MTELNFIECKKQIKRKVKKSKNTSVKIVQLDGKPLTYDEKPVCINLGREL